MSQSLKLVKSRIAVTTYGKRVKIRHYNLPLSSHFHKVALMLMDQVCDCNDPSRPLFLSTPTAWLTPGM